MSVLLKYAVGTVGDRGRLKPQTIALRCVSKVTTIETAFVSCSDQMSKNAKHAVRIVALGDSLTAGLQTRLDIAYPSRWTPYTKFLEKLAREHLGGRGIDIHVEILNKGVCGDLTSNMLNRFSRDVAKQKPDYVIILGGTNDIGWNLDPSHIADNLKTMYDEAESKRIDPVACAVPSILGFDDLIPPRLHLNNLIRREAETRRIAFVDLFSATADPATRRLWQRYSGDGIHLNTEGYQRLGETIFQQWLRRALESPGSLNPE